LCTASLRGLFLNSVLCIAFSQINHSVKMPHAATLTFYAWRSMLGIIAEWIILVPFDFGHYW